MMCKWKEKEELEVTAGQEGTLQVPGKKEVKQAEASLITLGV